MMDKSPGKFARAFSADDGSAEIFREMVWKGHGKQYEIGQISEGIAPDQEAHCGE